MNHSDFCMRRGKQFFDLKKEDFSLLTSINQQGTSKKRALLLLHGFSSSPAVYRYLIPQLKNYDALLCPVLPGHVESIAAFAETKASDWLSCAQKACEHLFKEYEKVDVLGLSLGALLACKLSSFFKFNHMFLLAPALKLQINIKKNLKVISVLRALGFNEMRSIAGDLKSKDHAEIAYKRVPFSSTFELLILIQEHQWTLPNCPIDLFLGAYDSVVASKQVEKMFSQLPETNIHWLAHSAHILPLDNDLDQIVQCINQRL
jgi:carboxylesterase